MSDKVSNLSEVRRNPSAECVRVLESLLESAKKGEIIEITTITLNTGGELMVSWSSSKDLLKQLQFVYRLAHIINKRLDNEIIDEQPI